VHARLYIDPEEAQFGASQVARVRLTNGMEVTCYIRRGAQLAGALHRADPRRRVKDLPGVRYHVVRGTLDAPGRGALGEPFQVRHQRKKGP